MTVAIPPLPGPVPQASDPVNFDMRADALLTALPDMITAMNEQSAKNNAINAGLPAAAAAAATTAANAAAAAAMNLKLDTANPAFTGNLTGGAGGTVNLGAGQLIKDAGGNLLLGGSVEYGSGIKNIVADGSGGAAFVASFNNGTARAVYAQDSSACRLGTNTNHPVVFRTNGNEVGAFDTAGNLGLGTQAPNFAITTYRAGAVAAYHQFANGSTGAGAGNGVLVGVDAGGDGVISVRGTQKLKVDVAGVERLRLTAAGQLVVTPSNVGVAASNFQIPGHMAITSVGGEQALLMGNQDSFGAAGPTVLRSANRALRIGVGDNWADPGGGSFTEYAQFNEGSFQLPDTVGLKIRLNGGAANYYGVSKLAGGGGLGDGEYRFTSGQTVAGAFTFHSGGVERLRLDSSGNVGVGTSSPTGRLTVEGSVAAGGTLNALTLRNSSDGGVGLYFDNAVSNNLASIEAQVAAAGMGTDDGILSFSTATDGVNIERMRIDASGNLLVGVTGGSCHMFNKTPGTGNPVLRVMQQNTIPVLEVFQVDGDGTDGANAANTALKTGKAGTGRSINVSGTINALGADYAEYEKNNGLKIAKGSIVGFKSDGTLTLTYSEAVRFAIKSTDPSYVGGDVWGSGAEVGKRPDVPVFVPPVYAGPKAPDAEPQLPPEADATAAEAHAQEHAQYLLDKSAYDAAFEFHACAVSAAQIEFDYVTVPAYQEELAAFEARLDAARQLVDRIAYSGKVPCNVLDTTPGDYIVAVAAEDGAITGVSVSEPGFARYRRAVGRVNRLLPDGRCEVAVIIH